MKTPDLSAGTTGITGLPEIGSASATPLARILGSAALLLGGCIAAGLMLRYGGLSALHVARTPGGAATMLFAGALLTAAGVPRQAIAFAAGYSFGSGAGLALALTAQMLGCAADYLWARGVAGKAARDWAARRLGSRMRRFQAMLSARPFAATLTLRLLPVGNNLLLNLLAGAAALRALPFLLATLVGYMPQTVIFVLAGSGTKLGKAAQVAVAAGLFLVSTLLGLWLLRYNRTALPDKAAPETSLPPTMQQR